MRSGIYKITNIINGSVYIGSSKNLEQRLKDYKQPKLSCVHKNIKESIQSFGYDNHKFNIMCEFDSNISRKELEIYEDAIILLYVDRLGEEKILNSRTNSGKWCSKEYINNQKLKHKGKKNTIEQNLKISKNHSRLGLFGKDNFMSLKVNQYSSDNIFIKTWDSLMDIERLLGIRSGNISAVCKGKRKSAGGFKWEYADK